MQKNVAKTGWELTKVARIGRSRSVYGQKRVEGGIGQSREPKLSVCCLHISAHPFMAKNRPGAPVFGHCPFSKLFLKYILRSTKDVSCEHDRCVVKTQLCKLRDTLRRIRQKSVHCTKHKGWLPSSTNHKQTLHPAAVVVIFQYYQHENVNTHQCHVGPVAVPGQGSIMPITVTGYTPHEARRILALMREAWMVHAAVTATAE